jgi:hypothetical protein
MKNSEFESAGKLSESSAIVTTFLLYKTRRIDFNTSKRNLQLILVTPSNSMKGVLERRWVEEIKAVILNCLIYF